ncbi:MAG: membrane protein insertion efficiency factor YidD [Candidatus Krumholzibacteria bacterium]|nr:membrane protein insertion efficiency factor YidD [Candidatus Krumholzibacteria bacterium]
MASGNAIYSFYQNYVSPIRGGRCPMQPSCSVYAMHAVKKYGLLAGFALSCEMLSR